MHIQKVQRCPVRSEALSHPRLWLPFLEANTVSSFLYVLPFFPGVKSSLDTWFPIPLFILVLFVFLTHSIIKPDILKKLEQTIKRKGNQQNHLNCYYPFNILESILAGFSHHFMSVHILEAPGIFSSQRWSKSMMMFVRWSDHYLPSPLYGEFQEAKTVLLVFPTPSRVPAHSRPVMHIFQMNDWMSEFPKGIAQYITLSCDLFFSLNVSAVSLHISS